MATYRKLQVFTKTTDFKQAVKLVEAPLVEPAADRIRVKQLYAGVNATDINITAARYFTDGKLPFDIGLEGLGLVDAIGADIPAGKFKVGQAVLVSDRASAQGFSEYVYKAPEALIPVPSADPKYLVSLVNGLTAAIALDKAGRVQKGDKVLVTAAAGGTGQIVVQWAKQRGAYVIGLTSTSAKAEYLKTIGADYVINYREQDLDKVLTEQFPEGVDVIWETIGGATFKTLFNHLGKKGRVVIIGSIQSYKGDGLRGVEIPDLNTRLLMKSQSLNGFVLFDWDTDIPEYLPKLIGGIANGTIKAQIDLGEKSPEGKFFGLDQAWRAEEWLHSSKNLGKVVVQIQNA